MAKATGESPPPIHRICSTCQACANSRTPARQFLNLISSETLPFTPIDLILTTQLPNDES